MTSRATAAATAAAAAARQRTASVTGKIREGKLAVAVVLVGAGHDLADVEHLSVDLLLRYQPGIGHAASKSVCRTARVDRRLRVSDLGPERRRAVADALRLYDTNSYRGRGPARRAS